MKNIFRITDPLWVPEQTVEQTIKAQVISEAIILIMTSL